MSTAAERLDLLRARKRRNSYAWRQRQRSTMVSLRKQLAELEKQVAGLHIVLTNTQDQTDKVDLSRRFSNLLIEKEFLKRENATLRMALDRRNLFLRAIQPSIPRCDLSDPRIQDDMFLLDHLQRVLHYVNYEVPTALSRGKPQITMIHGWRAEFIETGLQLMFKLERTVGLLHLDDVRYMSEYHWAQRNHKETYLNINKKAVDFTVIRRPQEDLSVVECILKDPDAVRVMIQFQTYLANGFDYCTINLSPDLNRMTTFMMVSVRVIENEVITTAFGGGTAIVDLPNSLLLKGLHLNRLFILSWAMSNATLVHRHIFGLKANVANVVTYVDDQMVAYPAGHTLVVYGLDDKKQKFITCTENTEGITSLSVCPSRRFIAIAEKSERGVVSIYDLKTLKKRKVLTTSDSLSKTYVSMEFSSDNQLLLTQGGPPDWTLVCWNWSKGKAIATIKLHSTGGGVPTNASSNPQYVTQCSFSNVDPSIVCCTGINMIKFFRIADTAFRPMPMARVDAQNFLCHTWLKQKEDEVVVGTAAGDLLLFRAGEFVCRLLASPGDSRSVVSMVSTSKGVIVGSDKSLVTLLVVNPDRNVPAVESLTFSKSIKVEAATSKVVGLTVSPNEDTVVAALSSAQVYIFPYQMKDSFKTEEIEYLVTPFHRQGENGLLHVTGMDVCIRKPTIVTCSLDKTVRVWNYIDRTCEVYKQFTEEAHSVSMHPSGLHILVGFADKLRLMNVLMDDIRPFKEFTIKACRECQFSTGGHLFAAVNGNTIQVFSMNTCDLIANLRGHNGKVRSLYWNYDDSGLISAGMDGAVYQWDLDEAKRDGEFVQKGVPYFAAVCNREGTSVYAVGADKMMKEIEFPASTLSKEFNAEVTLGQIVLSNSQRMLFAGAVESDKLGTVRSYKFPITGEFTEFQCLSSPITRMRISFDDLYLLVCGEDGVVCIFEIRDKEGRARPKDGRENTVFAEEILVTKSDLEEKNTLMIELKNKVDELTLHNEYQLRLKDMNYNEHLKEVTEKFTHEIEQEKNKFELLREDKNDIEMEYEERVKQMEEKHEQQMQEIEAEYQQKIMKEVEKYQDVLQQREQQRAKWQQEQQVLINTHERYVSEVTEDFEQRLDEDRQLRMQMEDEREELQKEFIETRTQLEEDIDVEIEGLKKRYEDKLAAEREATLRYKGENGIMKKKFTALQKDIEDQRDAIKNLLEKEKNLFEQIKNLEKEIQALKREIRGRDETIGEKEKRIYDLKKKNQELEKFKFVLDYKIKELKRQIEPRENEIADMKEQIKEMDRELELFHKSNAQLDIMIGEQRKRLDKMQADITRNRKIIGDQQSLIRRFRCDLYDTVQSIQNPKDLTQKVAQMFNKYVTTNIQAAEVDIDIQQEYSRQKEYLEKSVEVLKKKYTHDVTMHQQENNQARNENMALITEINEIRAALNVSKANLQKDKAILGTREYFAKSNGAPEDLVDVVDSQRLEIEVLRRAVKGLEDRLDAARTGGMLAPVRGIDG
ncbi:WD repeat-containing protein 65-like [Thraustotheca clavata]|uniref:WD repeat-containing protein 65-like n=1 Tax=Thraustotheca clavata TaxID=74557 RepID=A0A1W0AAV5_9STRA|nr:WD repeat-containing protein 65-like [Thraustotheca clavata]